MISIISAVAENGIIGRKNDLPWRLAADLSYFAKITKGQPVIMGLNTFQSIVSRLGKPLPGRKNIVLVFTKDPSLIGCEQATSLPEAFALAGAQEQEVFVIGGASVYQQAIDFADKLYLTRVHATPEGDTSFPEIKDSEWQMISAEDHQQDADNEYDYTFTIYARKK